MLENYNRFKVLKVFLNSPTESLGLREIARSSKISPASVLKYLRELEKSNLIEKLSKKEWPSYKASRDNEEFKFYKKISILEDIKNSGLVEEIWEKSSPEAVVLFGSYAKGESVENSDVDIFVIGKEREINLEKFRDKIGKEIHIFFESKIDKISKELRNNLINGIVLKGYLKLL